MQQTFTLDWMCIQDARSMQLGHGKAMSFQKEKHPPSIRIRELIVKNDKLDARRLSDMLRLNTFPESFIPDKKLKH